ncbi:MAG TPA: thioredoxin family protein [Chitinophagales bacterium]|nr:thioredoxin family protein [Chitinophagales bacterium]HMY23086.1 thioredoxin family protein [Chitinophagales bacterium]HNA38687.1 thioredoxin family protein [Chitinophagales bacterium]HNB48356.1 thioredoxin family protein [Chitinophagales bacterium]HNC71860.1 thioredoxin family protein [Chitinophagales bacterium]
MKNIFILIFVCMSTLTFAEDTGMQFENGASWQQILDKAKKENKFIFLDAYASWCGPCKWMAKEVFPKPEVGEALNPNYVNAKIDMEKGEGIELAKKYNVRSYPTYLFFDANGELVHRSLGSMPAADFITLCNNTLDPEMQFITLKKKYESGVRDTAFLRNFVENANNAQDESAQPALKDYLQQSNYNLSPDNIRLISLLTNSIHDTGYAILQDNKTLFYETLGIKNVDNQIEELVWIEAKKASKKGTDKEAFKKIIQQYLPEKTEILCAEFELSLLKRAANWKAYLPKALAFADKFCKNDFERLNSIAGTLWENYKDKTTLGKALQFALRSVELNSNFDNNDTVARLYQKLNNKSSAKKYAEISLALAQKEGIDTFSIEELLKALK